MIASISLLIAPNQPYSMMASASNGRSSDEAEQSGDLFGELEGKEISKEEIKMAIRKGTLDLKVTPAFCGSAFKDKGVQNVLDAIVDYLPSPLDVPAIEGVDPENEEKVSFALRSDQNQRNTLNLAQKRTHLLAAQHA